MLYHKFLKPISMKFNTLIPLPKMDNFLERKCSCLLIYLISTFILLNKRHRVTSQPNDNENKDIIALSCLSFQ